MYIYLIVVVSSLLYVWLYVCMYAYGLYCSGKEEQPWPNEQPIW